MRIALNGMFWAEPHVGSGQYLHQLLAELCQQAPHHQWMLVVPRYTVTAAPQIPGWQVVTVPTPFDRRSRNLSKLWFEQIAFGQACRKLGAQIMHVPYFAAPLQPPLPTVVTIHDVIPLVLPGYRGGRNVQMYMRLVARGAQRATAIIADSEHSRQDIKRCLGLEDQRVSVTYLAASPEYGPRDAPAIDEVRQRMGLPQRYVYYVGGFDRRKNVQTAIHAYAEATRDMQPRPRLAIAGRLPTTVGDLFPDIQATIHEAGVADDVTLLGPVSASDSAALMSGCATFVWPSHYEGFGLPPLEAMQCGAPVIASSTTSIGEVVADAGVLVHPDDLEGWVSALWRVLTDEAWADDLRQRGLRRAANFSWPKTAAQTLAIYEDVGARREARGTRN